MEQEIAKEIRALRREMEIQRRQRTTAHVVIIALLICIVLSIAIPGSGLFVVIAAGAILLIGLLSATIGAGLAKGINRIRYRGLQAKG